MSGDAGDQKEQTYCGVPLSQLKINSVVWSSDAEDHIRNRTQRKGRHDPGVEPEWATAAATGATLRTVSERGALVVFGWAEHMPPSGRVLKVFLRRVRMETGEWEGLTACVASESKIRAYQRNFGKGQGQS